MQRVELLKLNVVLHEQPVMLFMLLTELYVAINVLDQQYAANHGSVMTNPTSRTLNLPAE